MQIFCAYALLRVLPNRLAVAVAIKLLMKVFKQQINCLGLANF